MKTPREKLEAAEHILNNWLVDNTERVFEEEPEIDTARGLLLEVLEELK